LEQANVVFLAQSDITVAPDSGLFTWDLSLDLVYADGAVAQLFGLDRHEAEHGLPLDAYMRRVHPEDRSRLAEVIRDTIIAQSPQQEEYRVRNADGVYASVASFGRCFRNRDDVPVLYSGIVILTQTIDRDTALS
jgi:PAS domain-containing protein